MHRGHYMRRSRDLPGDSLSCMSFRSMNSSVLKLRPCCFIWRRFLRTSIDQCVRTRPRRAVMYVPGTDRRKMEKVRSLNVDSAVLDLEDGVALNQKDNARALVPQFLKTVDFGSTTERVVRVNSAGSGLLPADVTAVLGGDSLPDALMLPKVENEDHLRMLDSAITEASREAQLNSSCPLPLYILIESPLALLNLQSMCKWSQENQNLLKASLQVVVFGCDDYTAALGGRKTESAAEVLYARQHLVTVAKAYGLQAIDMVHINYKDLASLASQSTEGANMGYDGKQVIHPSQAPVVQSAFSPSPGQVEWARELIRAFEEHQAKGKGAFEFRGQMIDRPLLLQARNTLTVSEQTQDA